MGTLGLESVLIGDVVDSVGDTIIAQEGERSTDGDGLILGSGVYQMTRLLLLRSIAGLHTVGEREFNPAFILAL